MESVSRGERRRKERHCWSLRLEKMAWRMTSSLPLMLLRNFNGFVNIIIIIIIKHWRFGEDDMHSLTEGVIN